MLSPYRGPLLISVRRDVSFAFASFPSLQFLGLWGFSSTVGKQKARENAFPRERKRRLPRENESMVYLRIPVVYSFDARWTTWQKTKTYKYTKTHTQSMYTRYRYQLLLLLLLYSTATIITIIGCLSIRLTPSSGPNYYVTIFIDNKGRNKHWSKIIVIKKKTKKNEKKTKWLLYRYYLALPWLYFRVSSCSALGILVLFLSLDLNNRLLGEKKKLERLKIDTLPLFVH